MIRRRMLDVLITWLPIVGPVLLGYAFTVWFTPTGNNSHAIWLGAAGAIALILGLAFHLQKIVWTADPPPAGERPMVGIGRIDVSPIVAGGSLRATVYFINSGTRPALNVRAHVQSTTVPRGGQPPPALTALPLPNNPSAVMMPSGEMRIVAFDDNQFALSNQADVNVITTGTLTPWITARVEYQDGGGRNYFTTFRASLDLRVGTYVAAPSGNDAN